MTVLVPTILRRLGIHVSDMLLTWVIVLILSPIYVRLVNEDTDKN